MDQPSRVLLLSDLSPASDIGFTHARMIAQRFGARLLIYHAMEVPSGAYVDWGGPPEQARRTGRAEEVRAELHRRYDDASSGVPCEVVVERDVVTSSLHRAIEDLIAERRPDLTVLTTHSRSGVARVLMGSVAAQLLHEGVRPLLCVPPGARPAEGTYRRVLVPTDLSAASRRALAWARLLARGFDSQLLAAYVTPPPTVAVLSGLAASPPVPRGEDVRRFLAPELAAADLEVEVAGSSPAWSAILRLVAEREADLVVMSSRGQDSLGDHILGSTADRVIRRSPVPVLVA